MTLSEAVLKRLKDIMEEKEFTLYRLHKEGGIAKSTLSQVLNGRGKSVELITIYQILATMNVSLGEFFSDPLFKLVTD